MEKVKYWLSCGIVALILAGLSAETAQAKEYEIPAVDPCDFNSPQDNLYLPMALGETYVYEAETDDEVILNEITMTYDTKEILGVTCVVVYDVEWVFVEDQNNWFLIEETNDWYAWDNYGNVWYFGEETSERIYDEDWNWVDTSTEGSWEAGVDGATAGIVMLANPAPGISYRQEYYEDVAEDMGKVMRLNVNVSVEYGDFENCLKTKEWTGLEPGNIEQKFYAPEVGLVMVKELKEKTVLVELIDVY